jgi:hypothetical protein
MCCVISTRSYTHCAWWPGLGTTTFEILNSGIRAGSDVDYSDRIYVNSEKLSQVDDRHGNGKGRFAIVEMDCVREYQRIHHHSSSPPNI